MTRKICVFSAVFLLLFSYRQMRADDPELNDGFDLNPQGRLVILGSGRNYSALLRQANVIGRKSGVRVWLMGRTFDPKEGWTSEGEGDGVGGYCLRNASDGGENPFISIERSDAYPGLERGYFIIVGDVSLSAKEAAASLARFKKLVPDAYAPVVTIYIGCRH